MRKTAKSVSLILVTFITTIITRTAQTHLMSLLTNLKDAIHKQRPVCYNTSPSFTQLWASDTNGTKYKRKRCKRLLSGIAHHGLSTEHRNAGKSTKIELAMPRTHTLIEQSLMSHTRSHSLRSYLRLLCTVNKYIHVESGE